MWLMENIRSQFPGLPSKKHQFSQRVSLVWSGMLQPFLRALDALHIIGSNEKGIGMLCSEFGKSGNQILNVAADTKVKVLASVDRYVRHIPGLVETTT